jgi:hypothetical protein
MLPPLGIYIEGEARQVTYRLNCSGEFTRARFGHSKVFKKMTDGHDDQMIIFSGPRGQNRSYYCFCKKVFSRTSTKKLLAKPGNVGNFARRCDFLPLCEGRASAGVFSDTLDIRDSIGLGSLATVFQTKVYTILACSDYCWSANMHNMTICICSDSKAALLALSSYTIASKLLDQCWLSTG